MLIDTVQPTLHVLEAVLTCDIKNHNDSVSLPVKTLSHTSEAVLPCGIPNLHIDRLSIGCREGIRVELDTYGGNIILFELFVLVHLEDGGLADSAITKSDKLHPLSSSHLVIVIFAINIIIQLDF